jgi:hypothetical protein
VLRADFDVDVAAATIGGLIGIAPLNVEGIAHYEPLKVDLELSHPIDAWTLVAGARYERWSALPSFAGRTVECPPGVSCGTPAPQSPDYSDVVVPRLGVERTFAGERVQLTARAGYSFVRARAGAARRQPTASTRPGTRSPRGTTCASRATCCPSISKRVCASIGWHRGRTTNPPPTRRARSAPRSRPSGHLVTWALGARLEL